MLRAWKGTLLELVSQVHFLEMSLKTIDSNSLMHHYPPNMLEIDDIIDDSEVLGREGELSHPESEAPMNTPGWTTDRVITADNTEETETPRGQWGRR